MKKYATARKWTKEKPTTARVTNLNHFYRGLKESAKMAFDRLPWFARKKRSWDH